MKKRFVLGITGGVGAGKSTVLQYLHKKYNAVLLQCDAIGMELQQKGMPCYSPIVEAFGTDILRADGQLNREKLSKIVFSAPEALSRLNAIVHPAVKQEVRRRIETAEEENRHDDIWENEESGKTKEPCRNRDYQLYVIEAALLLEDHYEEICDQIWYIYADPATRIQRLMRDRGYTEEKCRRIMAAQRDDVYYRSRCQEWIDNSTDLTQDTFDQLDAAIGRWYDRMIPEKGNKEEGKKAWTFVQ